MDDSLREYFAADELAGLLGIKALSAGEGKAAALLELGKGHRNGLGTVHGGTIFALADFTFAMACNSRGRIAVAASATISFMKAATSASLIAEAEEVAASARLGTYLVRVAELHADGSRGDMVALFQGTAYRKKETIEDVLAGRGK